MELKNAQNSNDFENLLEEMNRNIFNKEIADIVEVTYAYATLWDGRVVNKTLFWTFLGQEYKQNEKETEKDFWIHAWNNIKNLHDQVLVKLTFKKQVLERYKNKLLSLSWSQNPKAQILLWTIEYVDKILDLTLTWLPFEAEKAWLPHNLNKREFEWRIKRLEEIEKDLFGPMVRKTKYEIQGSYNHLITLFEEQKEKLTPEEQEKILKYLSILKNKFSSIDENMEIKETHIEIDNILKKDILREDYVKILQMVMNIYAIDKPIKVEERSSIYDGETHLWIPESDAYKTLKLQRILELIQHEIETHYIIEENNKKTLWNFRWAGNLQREEWLAMTSEWILMWKTLDDITVSWAIPDLLLWEILSWDEYREFLLLHAKLKGTKNAAWTFLRRKRNYPLSYPWVQHKDTSYNRWQHLIVKFLKKGGNVKDFYVWKVSFTDIEKTKQILSNGDIKLLYPLLIWELLQYVLVWNKLQEDEFWNYIEGKYPFLDIRQEIAQKTISRLTVWTKRKVVEILQLIRWKAKQKEEE